MCDFEFAVGNDRKLQTDKTEDVTAHNRVLLASVNLDELSCARLFHSIFRNREDMMFPICSSGMFGSRCLETTPKAGTHLFLKSQHEYKSTQSANITKTILSTCSSIRSIKLSASTLSIKTGKHIVNVL